LTKYTTCGTPKHEISFPVLDTIVSVMTTRREAVFYLEIARHFGGECLCKLDNGMMQIYGGCVLEQLGLLHHSIDNIRMAMAARNCHDTPKAIEVSLPMLVIQILHLSLHNVELLTQLK
jgi:hypothetical protein